jgi:hypothetical protein
VTAILPDQGAVMRADTKSISIHAPPGQLVAPGSCEATPPTLHREQLVEGIRAVVDRELRLLR